MDTRRKICRRRRNNFCLILVLIVTVIIALIFGGRRLLAGRERSLLLSREVLGYVPVIEQYASVYDMEAYIPLVEAVMMQESAGQGSDPMQASACVYNKKYSTAPGGIQDPEYSVEAGIQYLKHCLTLAGCQGAGDIERISLALQGYNYGSGYITWVQENGEGYSEENALAFSVMMQERHGTSAYGDTAYVAHVLRYYPPAQKQQRAE